MATVGKQKYNKRAWGEKAVSKFNLANPVLPSQGQGTEVDVLTCHDRKAVCKLCTVGVKND